MASMGESDEIEKDELEEESRKAGSYVRGRLRGLDGRGRSFWSQSLKTAIQAKPFALSRLFEPRFSLELTCPGQ
jgi:hypothetical protein